MTWTQNLLRINLSEKTMKVEKIPKQILHSVIGGKGLGAYYLNRELDPKTDPLSPDNIFILATGPAQGVLPIAGRYCIVTKSPHTDMFIDSHVGGHLGPELKFAGYDAIIVRGKAKEPSFIEIVDDRVEIKPARHLWGKDVIATTDELQQVIKGARVIAIGPAGENQVHFASTNSDYYRTTGRGGVGMIFGSKKLKAIAIKGTNRVRNISDEIKEIRSDINKRSKQSRGDGHELPKLGSSWLVQIANARDQLPTKNYQRGEWENVDKIDGERLHKKYADNIINTPCYRCSLACAFQIDSNFDWTNGEKIQHPEYESIGLLGANLGISNLETILHLNHLCNTYGMDTISTGSTIAWFMECSQKSKIPDKYRDEAIEFGDEMGALELVHKIAMQKGVGKVLGRGVRRAAEIFGNNTDKFAVHVRGLELPAWDPRGKLGLGLSYITSNVGGSHLRGWPRTSKIPQESAIPVIDSMIEEQDLKILKDSFIMCHFTHSIKPPFDLKDAARLYQGFTGIKTTVYDIRSIAQNIWLLCRKFNVNAWEHTPRETDVLPYRLMHDELPSGIAKGKTAFISNEDLQQSLDIFYEKRECSEEGIPSDESMRKLQHLLK